MAMPLTAASRIGRSRGDSMNRNLLLVGMLAVLIVVFSFS
jgi:hypothetical protein